MTHCPECHNLSGTCPGCPECADAAEWHKAIMEENCGDEEHCTCVPVLRKAVKEKSALIADCEVENVRLRQEIARLTSALEASERRIVTIMGNLCHELRVNAPGEDAVANWQTVMDDVACLRDKHFTLQAATRKVMEAAHGLHDGLDEYWVTTEEGEAATLAMGDALSDPAIATLRRE